MHGWKQAETTMGCRNSGLSGRYFTLARVLATFALMRTNLNHDTQLSLLPWSDHGCVSFRAGRSQATTWLACFSVSCGNGKCKTDSESGDRALFAVVEKALCDVGLGQVPGSSALYTSGVQYICNSAGAHSYPCVPRVSRGTVPFSSCARGGVV